MQDTLVIIPTYNEKENIENIINATFSQEKSFDILIVDDNSPDGTADIVRKLQIDHPKSLYLEVRDKKDGLGRAYIHGFKWAIERKYDYIIEMDADFSHNPKDLVRLYNKCVEEDGLLDKGWIAITDYYFRKKNYQKALYYIDKAINIDSENVLYWKRYAKINNRLNLFEEAEHGFRRALELGNYELETWITRCDILMHLGEFQAAINNLHQACEFYPESAEIEYRLAGLFYQLGEERKGSFHLKNALKIEPDYMIIIEELFPIVLEKAGVQQIVAKHKKPSV